MIGSKIRIYDAAVIIVYMSGHGVREGMDGGYMPLQTRLRRYCDPASPVLQEAYKIGFVIQSRHYDSTNPSHKASPTHLYLIICIYLYA